MLLIAILFFLLILFIKLTFFQFAMIVVELFLCLMIVGNIRNKSPLSPTILLINATCLLLSLPILFVAFEAASQ